MTQLNDKRHTDFGGSGQVNDLEHASLGGSGELNDLQVADFGAVAFNDGKLAALGGGQINDAELGGEGGGIIVPTPSFEQPNAGWVPVFTPLISERSQEKPHTGAWSWKLQGTGAGNAGFENRTTMGKLPQAGHYNISFWIWFAGWYTTTLRFYEGATALFNGNIGNTFDQINGWFQYNLQTTTPAVGNLDGVIFQLYMASAPDPCYIDDISITPV